MIKTLFFGGCRGIRRRSCRTFTTLNRICLYPIFSLMLSFLPRKSPQPQAEIPLCEKRFRFALINCIFGIDLRYVGILRTAGYCSNRCKRSFMEGWVDKKSRQPDFEVRPCPTLSDEVDFASLFSSTRRIRLAK